MAEKFAFEQVVRDRRAVHRHEGLVAAPDLAWMWRAMTSLPVPLSPVTSTEASERAICSASFTTRSIGVAPHEGAAVGGHRLDDRRDEVGIGRQGDVFAGAGLDRRDRGARIRAGAAGDDRRADPLGARASTSRPIGWATSIMIRSAPLTRRTVRPWSTPSACVTLAPRCIAIFGGRDELAVQPSDNEKTHRCPPLILVDCRVKGMRLAVECVGHNEISRFHACGTGVSSRP